MKVRKYNVLVGFITAKFEIAFFQIIQFAMGETRSTHERT